MTPPFTIVTSALPYINGVKHLGNLVGSLLPADIFTRYLRLKGEPVVFISGTDEHGAPAEIAAAAEGMSPKEYCDALYEIQSSNYRDFGISCDYFGRSSSRANHDVTRHLFRRLYDNHHIAEGTIVQLYDVEAGRFLPDRYVVGTCPHCGYTAARGDQCDNCTRLLDAIQLVSPRSTVSGSSALERREAKQLFLQLSHFENRLGAWIESKAAAWPTTTISIARKWVREGLRDRSITRDLTWGVSVPLRGYEDQVFYVWFDAPNAYIAMTEEWAVTRGRPGFGESLWKDEGTRVVQFMAKDNVPFHTIVWPAMLMGADEGYQLATVVKGFEYLNYEGGKFSTSNRRGVFLDDALAEFPPDYWRYYLMTIVPERADTDFSWPGFQRAIDNVADTLGNFVHRTLTFIMRYCDGIVPVREGGPAPAITATVSSHLEDMARSLDGLEFNQWMRSLRTLWAEGNRYFDAEQPWVTRKTDPACMRATLATAADLVHLFAVVTSPLLPHVSRQILAQLQIDDAPECWRWPRALDTPYRQGHRLSLELRPLVTKIPDERIEELSRRYAGQGAAIDAASEPH